MEPIKAGYPLTTEILSTEIEVSQTPVRDALQKLKADGLVRIVDRQGAGGRNMDVRTRTSHWLIDFPAPPGFKLLQRFTGLGSKRALTGGK